MHTSCNWGLKEPIDVFFFDCDGTLSLIEGIDVLATMNGVAEKVHTITSRCMGQTGLSPDDYRERLAYVQPTTSQLAELAEFYRLHSAPGAYELIQLLQSLNKKVYVISAGIKTAVSQFAQSLGIPSTNVLAVDVYFDKEGKYQGFDEQSNMVHGNGKSVEIASILKPGERALLLGDGMSDWEARNAVSRFIGYAGLNAKEWVKEHSDFYITTPSLYPTIPLGLTVEESRQLSVPHSVYYELGLADLNQSGVLIKENIHVHCSTT